MYQVLFELRGSNDTYALSQNFSNDVEARRAAERHYTSNSNVGIYAIKGSRGIVLYGTPGKHWADSKNQTKSAAELYGGTFIVWGR